MNGAIALKQYQQMGAHGGVMDASPHKLIQMLLDGALSRILSAKSALKQNEVAKKGEQIGSAISIIEGLRASLDFNQGGEISKNLDDPAKLEELLNIFEERKKAPIDYRRNGVITIFVGIGLYLFGYIVIGYILEGVGLLIGTIGIGTLIAGYLYPNTGKELTDAVEKYEKK